MTENIEVLTHSSIRIKGNKTMYIDPFRVPDAPHDADVILITHDHFDHFSPEDIKRIIKADTVLVVPEAMKESASAIACDRVRTVVPGMSVEFDGFKAETVPAYNNGKPFHPKANGWVGYIIEIDGVRIYIAGDTDMTADNRVVKCDVAMVPIGGKYTMDAQEAAELVNIICPKIAIPTHYGSVAGGKEDEITFCKLVDQGIKTEIKMQQY